MSQQPDRGKIRPVEMGKSRLTNGTMRSTLKILVLCAMLAITGVATTGTAVASHGHSGSSGDDVDVDVEINVDGCSDLSHVVVSERDFGNRQSRSAGR